jgi:hypothetical protein
METNRTGNWTRHARLMVNTTDVVRVELEAAAQEERRNPLSHHQWRWSRNPSRYCGTWFQILTP